MMITRKWVNKVVKSKKKYKDYDFKYDIYLFGQLLLCKGL